MYQEKFNGLIRSVIFGMLLFPGMTVIGQDEIHTSAHSIYAGAGFTNNMVYMGTSISRDKPVYSGSLTYGFKDRLYLSVSSNHLSAFDPFLAFHTFSLSYVQEVNSWFDISLAVSRYQVAPSLTDTLFASFLYGNLALGFDWKILYTNASIGGVFSTGNNAYLQLKNSRYFETGRLMRDKAFLSFDPYVNMLFGSLTKSETSEGTMIGISRPFSSRKTGKDSSQKTTTFFGFMELDMGVPVAFNAGRFTLEAEPGYVYTVYSDTGIFNPEGFIFMVNIYIKIF